MAQLGDNKRKGETSAVTAGIVLKTAGFPPFFLSSGMTILQKKVMDKHPHNRVRMCIKTGPMLFLLLLTTSVSALDNPKSSGISKKYLTTELWLKDATTFEFDSPTERRDKHRFFTESFNGLRIVFEPQLGTIFQGGQNQIEVPNLSSLGKIGFETNLYKGFIGLQGLVIYPSKIQYDPQSLYRVNGNIVDTLGWVDVNVGMSFGLTFFDGIIAVGYTHLFCDERDYKNKNMYPNFRDQTGFWYLNVQPIAAIKSLFKRE